MRGGAHAVLLVAMMSPRSKALAFLQPARLVRVRRPVAITAPMRQLAPMRTSARCLMSSDFHVPLPPPGLPLSVDPLASVRIKEAKAATKAKEATSASASCAARPSSGKGGDVKSTITPRAVDYSAWYQDVVFGAEMVDGSPVRGCTVLRPWGMAVWDALRAVLDAQFRKSGVENAYFPLLLPLSFLAKEAEHVEGFAKECAVVTHHRLAPGPDGKLCPDPTAKLEEPLVVRPTSETMIWHMFGRWIKSHRDLPLKLNQWANVVRWELRTRPFLRSSEFLWQEGHTAHATEAEARATAREMLDVYEDVCRRVLAIPVVKGVKSASERFAGAEETYTIEALMQNGWALQSGTSHFLGQNFAKAFGVEFASADKTRSHVWATSWGVSTRLLGATVMVHADDEGLVLPPHVAPVQVVIVPILGKTAGEDEAVRRAADLAAQGLVAAGLRAKVDGRDFVRPGAKFFEWERKGVPLRLEVGPRDVASGFAVAKARPGWRKDRFKLPLEPAALATAAAAELALLQGEMLAAAEAALAAGTRVVGSFGEMEACLAAADAAAATSAAASAIGGSGAVGAAGKGDKCGGSSVEYGSGGSGGVAHLGFFLAPWAADDANEAAIKARTRATIRCYPLARQHEAVGKACFFSGAPATHMALFARAF